MTPTVHQDGDDVLVRVRALPRAGANAVGGLRDGALLVRVTAPPADGRANNAICRVLARAAGVAPTQVTIERGAAGRDKVLRLAGASAVTVATRLGTSP